MKTTPLRVRLVPASVYVTAPSSGWVMVIVLAVAVVSATVVSRTSRAMRSSAARALCVIAALLVPSVKALMLACWTVITAASTRPRMAKAVNSSASVKPRSSRQMLIAISSRPLRDQAREAHARLGVAALARPGDREEEDRDGDLAQRAQRGVRGHAAAGHDATRRDPDRAAKP